MYRELAQNAAVLAAFVVPIWIVARITIRRRVSAPFGREVVLFVALLYAIIVAVATVMPLRMATEQGRTGTNLIPLKALSCLPEQHCAENLVGNVVLFFPLGILVPLLFPRGSTFRRTLATAVLTSLAIEATQQLQRLAGTFRSVDVDDVLLNVVGAVIGYALVRFVRPIAAGDPRVTG